MILGLLVKLPYRAGVVCMGIGKWAGLMLFRMTTTHATPAGNVVAVDGVPGNFPAGVTAVADQTHPDAIPANTAVTSFNGSSVTISNPVVSPGVQVNDVLMFSNPSNSTGGCVVLNGGIQLLFSIQPICDNNGYYTQFNGQINAWGVGAIANGRGFSSFWLPTLGYIGYNNTGGPVFY